MSTSNTGPGPKKPGKPGPATQSVEEDTSSFAGEEDPLASIPPASIRPDASPAGSKPGPDQSAPDKPPAAEPAPKKPA